MAMKRVSKELKDLRKEDLGVITLGPRDDNNLFEWEAEIPGPEGSVYEGGLFVVSIHIPNDYP